MLRLCLSLRDLKTPYEISGKYLLLRQRLMTAVPWYDGGSLVCGCVVRIVGTCNCSYLGHSHECASPTLLVDDISVIASDIGDPLHTENSRLEPFHFGDTKVKVEIKLETLPPLAVIVGDTDGFSVRVNVEYPRLPPKCCNCGRFWHSLKYCTLPIQRKNFKANQVFQVFLFQVMVVDKDLNPEYSSSICIEETSSTLVLENIADTPGVLDDKGDACVVEPSVKVIPEDATSHLWSTGFPPFTGKPSLRFLTHRLDRNTKLRIQHPSHSVKERPAPPLIHSSLPHPSTESEEPLEAKDQSWKRERFLSCLLQ
ncbi:hypothetical protein Bca101_083250 [Brassica carinata]